MLKYMHCGLEHLRALLRTGNEDLYLEVSLFLVL